MKQKVVISVSMNGQKARSKALQIAAGVPGLESAALAGGDKNTIEVTGDGIDVVVLTTLLRKKFGHAQLVSVNPVGEEKDKSEKNEATPTPMPPVVWSHGWSHMPQYVYEVTDTNHDALCSIM